jgi:hypothetical protein
MTDAGGLEPRVTALEEQVRNLTERVRASEQDAAAARVLAGAADRDAGEVRTDVREFREQNNGVLNAMREDLTDFRAHVDDGFIDMRGRLDQAAAGQAHIAELLQRLIDQEGRE